MSGATAIAAGGSHTCALTSAGGVKCWGVNTYGQLGDHTNIARNIPVGVAGLSSGMIGLSASYVHTCALTSVGGVKCWGDNQNGQLGNNTFTDSNIPVDVAKLSSGVIGLGAGMLHTCALTTMGGGMCWGDNIVGELGDGTNTNSPSPVNVSGLASDAIELAVGGHHNCVVTSKGGVKCWGQGTSGELGNGALNVSNIPVDVVGLPSGVISLAPGSLHTCAVLEGTGPLRCWGSNASGQLADGGATDGSNIPIISKWLTADGLVEDQKAAVINLPNLAAVVVVPPQAVPAPEVVTVEEVLLPPLDPILEPQADAAFLWNDEKGPVAAFFYYDFPYTDSATNALQSAAAINASGLNLYHYLNGKWTPVLPCTGCSLDPTTHVLIATLNSPGIYAVMAKTRLVVYLPKMIH